MDALNIVETKNLVVRLGGRVALDGVTLSIRAGAFTGIVGPNGAGKTTLLKTLLGLITPASGEILVFGHKPGEAHHLIGYVPQTPRLDPKFPISVFDVALMGRLGKRATGDDRAHAARALEQVGMAHAAATHFGSLSGGERQRVLIARALAGGPRLLLLDEPATGVDAPGQDSFYAMLKDFIVNHSMTIVMVSHDIGVITSLVDDLICLNQTVFCHGPPAQALASAMIGQAYGTQAELLLHGHAIPHRAVREHGCGPHEPPHA